MTAKRRDTDRMKLADIRAAIQANGGKLETQPPPPPAAGRRASNERGKAA